MGGAELAGPTEAEPLDAHRLSGLIADISEKVRADPDVKQERRLAGLRHRLFASTPPSEPPASWPPDLADPFPEVSGRPPEVGADELDAAIVGGAIAHHGCLIVRGLLRPPAPEELVEGIERAFAGLDRFLESGPTPERDPWYAAFPVDPTHTLARRRGLVRNSGAVWVAESPRLMAQVLDHFARTPLVDAIEGYLGEHPALSVNKFTFRRVAPDTWPSFHQDGAFMGGRIRTVNAWVALSDCGPDAEAPGLAIVPRRIEEILETGTKGAMVQHAVGTDVVDRVARDAPVMYPTFRAGDAMLFDEVFLHSTGTVPGKTQDRYAIEAWFFAPSDVPPDYVGLAV